MALYLQRSPEVLGRAMEADAKIEELQDLQADTANIVFNQKKEIKSLRLCVDALIERVTTLELLVGRRFRVVDASVPPPPPPTPSRSHALFRLEHEG